MTAVIPAPLQVVPTTRPGRARPAVGPARLGFLQVSTGRLGRLNSGRATRAFNRDVTVRAVRAKEGHPIRGLRGNPDGSSSVSAVHAKARAPPIAPISMPMKKPPRLDVIHDHRASKIARTE